MGERGYRSRGIARAPGRLLVAAAALLILAPALEARPRYLQNLRRHYGSDLPRALDACTTCHVRKEEAPDPEAFEKKPPHNPFGLRLKELGKRLRAEGKPSDLVDRLLAARAEDSDGDGVPNEIELLAGHAPGDLRDVPTSEEAAAAALKQKEIERMRAGYRWQPFRRVERPAVPEVKRAGWARNPVDAFLAREHEERGLEPRPEAPRAVLLRRVYLDLIGLPPHPEELRAFLADDSPDAYEKVVDRLLARPQYGERWARHWMDIWRYSDWAGWGNQVRDSQPHIWRWRDWIVEALNSDRGYDRMVLEMLAGDELAPLDPAVLRATGYLARSFKLLSREAWMQEAVDHAGQAFLGVTVGCARCHDHMFDPISQKDYYQLRAIFEPYNVRLDRVPGQRDLDKDGLPRAFDLNPEARTFLYVRGDDRNPDKENPLSPMVPEALGGPEFKVEPVSLPLAAQVPEKQEFQVEEALAASEEAERTAGAAFEASVVKFAEAERALAQAPGSEKARARLALEKAREESELLEMSVPVARAERRALSSTIRAEGLEDAGTKAKDPEAWKKAATEATAAQRVANLLRARRDAVREARELARARWRWGETAEAAAGNPHLEGEVKKAREARDAAERKGAESEKALARAKEDSLLPPSPDYKKRDLKTYPASSTGRRLALARWIAHRDNPLAARVAVNHIWLRHFGRGLVPSMADFGQNGRPPSHPALLDWLAAELMEPTVSAAAGPWSMKAIHRLLVTSTAYRMASTPKEGDLAIDPDNRFVWRMSSRRLEAEAVRDSVLEVAGVLEPALGGPELDQKLCLSTHRRSLYYRQAAEKQPEFLQVFDMAGPAECYERKSSVVPQQALALTNSELTLSSARLLARSLWRTEETARTGSAPADPAAFVARAFEVVLARPATATEVQTAVRFLAKEEELLAREKSRLTVTAASPSDGGKPSGQPEVRARENLVQALMNHHEFVTVR